MSAAYTESANEPPAPATPEKRRVFLSYSRKDADFLRRLADALDSRGYAATFDQTSHRPETGNDGISPTDDWWLRLQDMIAAADVMVLIVSPDSAASRPVDEEIAYARSLSKRVIAITCREVDFRTAPPRLSALNVNHWFLALQFEAALEELATALDRDVDWLRKAARYTSQAKAWTDANRQPDKLLFGAEIALAEAWSARRPTAAPEISELVLGYLAASRSAQTDRETREKRTVRRTRSLQRCIAAAIAATLIATIAGGWFVINGQRTLGRSQSLMLARASEKLADDGDFQRSLHLAILAARDTFLAPAAPEANAALNRAAQALPLRASLNGHDGDVTAIIYSSDGAFIATASDDNTARVWNASTGVQIAVLKGVSAPIAFSPDGHLLATSGSSDELRLWDARTGAAISVVHGNGVGATSIAFSPDGSLLATMADGIPVLRSPLTGAELRALPAHSNHGTSMAFSPDGMVLATSNAGDIKLWNTATGAQAAELQGHLSDIDLLVWNRQGSRLASIGRDHTVRTWDPRGSGALATLKFANGVQTLVFSHDGTMVATADWNDQIDLWNVDTGEHRVTLMGDASATQTLAFAPDDKTLLSATWDDSLIAWDTMTGELKRALVLPQDDLAGAAAFAFSPDATHLTFSTLHGAQVWDIRGSGEAAILPWSGDSAADIAVDPGWTYLAAATHDGSSAMLWNLKTLAAPVILNGPVRRLVFSPNGQRLLTSAGPPIPDPNASGDFQLWNVASGVVIARLDELKSDVLRTVFSQDGKRLVTVGENALVLWNGETGAPIARLDNLKTRFAGVAFNPRSKQLAISDADGLIRLWDSSSGAEIRRLAGATSNTPALAFSPDGSKLAASGDVNLADVWDISTGKKLVSLAGHDLPIESLAFTPDGKRIATGSEDHTARLWDAASGAQLAVLEGNEAGVIGLEFNADGSRLYTYSPYNETIRLWDGVTGAPIGRLAGGDAYLYQMAFTPDGSRLMTSGENTTHIWDTVTGEEIGTFSGLKNGMLSPDSTRLLTTDDSGAAIRLWDLHWLRTPIPATHFVADVCASKLQGAETPALVRVATGTEPGEHSVAPVTNLIGTQLTGGPRRLDGAAVKEAPILRGREGEDVCAWSPPWYDDLLRAAIGWSFN